MNPIEEYRKAQRRLRRLFEPFTAANCPSCVTPCCRKPTWVRPTDVVLVEELGYLLPRPEGTPAANLVNITLGAEVSGEGDPCDYLQARGCAFPADLRPFGCAAMICEPMRRTLPEAELVVIERAVGELEAAHGVLMEALYQPGGTED